MQLLVGGTGHAVGEFNKKTAIWKMIQKVAYQSTTLLEKEQSDLKKQETIPQGETQGNQSSKFLQMFSKLVFFRTLLQAHRWPSCLSFSCSWSATACPSPSLMSSLLWDHLLLSAQRFIYPNSPPQIHSYPFPVWDSQNILPQVNRVP